MSKQQRKEQNEYTTNDILRIFVWIGIIVILGIYFVKSKQPKQPVQSTKPVSQCYSEPTKYPPYRLAVGYRCHPRSRYIYWGGMDETKASTEQSISDSMHYSKPISNYGVDIGRFYKKQIKGGQNVK